MKSYPKIYYLHWVLLVLWSGLLVFSLLISFGVISWHSEVTALQYIVNVLGIFTAATNICTLKKKNKKTNSPS